MSIMLRADKGSDLESKKAALMAAFEKAMADVEAEASPAPEAPTRAKRGKGKTQPEIRVRMEDSPKRERATTDGQETRREKTMRIGGARMKGILEGLRILGNCRPANGYEWSARELEWFRDAVTKALGNTLDALQGKGLAHNDDIPWGK